MSDKAQPTNTAKTLKQTEVKAGRSKIRPKFSVRQELLRQTRNEAEQELIEKLIPA